MLPILLITLLKLVPRADATVSDTNECASSPCSNNGTCVDGFLNFTCICVKGTLGNRCQYEDPCFADNNPCQLGWCVSNLTTGEAQCVCLSWTVGQFCQYVNYCYDSFNPCSVNGQCVSPLGANAAQCICNPGFFGNLCQFELCPDDINLPCSVNGQCGSPLGANDYQCICKPDFFGNRCQYDNCLDDINPCSQNTEGCVRENATQWILCQCAPGFAGNLCEYVAGCDINLTVTDTKQYVATKGYPHNYNHNQDCNFNFKAPSGRKIIVMFEDFNLEDNYDFLYFPQGIRFYDKPPTFRSDSNSTTLRFTSNGRILGYGILMAYILDVDDCSTSPCENGAICVDKHGGYTCQCTDQWLGENCTEFNNCHPNPCINGTCEDFDHIYTCSCFDGYKGTNCDETNPACADITCQNGGSCIYINETSNAVCSCYNNFAGKFCEDSICGKSAIPPVTIFENKKRIVGGMEVVANAWPWQVFLQLPGRYNCGGSIISPEVIVTAAHCGPVVNDTILLGAHDVRNCQESEGCMKVQITEVWSYPRIGYDYPNDIAVVRFSPPISQFTDKISPICLPQPGDEDKLPIGAHCYATGWGAGSRSNDLYQVHVELVNQSVCDNLLNPEFDQNLMICAGDVENGGRDTCGGDSGGPLMCQLPGQENWKLFGITSWGNQCAAVGSPGVYTRVVNYLNWIQNILN